ncbi:PTS glucitol/sorbitol transporter subunit IIA [Maledivibacter halophilus]|uniref:PTS system, glucitol/sorbitol-specific IIA component n=1 Tax=Maledivibacter halophilus TaxID=36842 RepID=A0A1T5MI55_9FIRM|nr:PTS glucitol/sorbitol transporter subunit IIA [Maledivibacter halophilus]SKC87875.1 PTS system, glucitol/sorbitol-specific IIA component [Maledivibacter halophilus]
MKYQVEIVKFGQMVKEFLDGGMMIIFNDNAPPELAEISVLHTYGNLQENIEAGDRIKIGNMEYLITSIGHEANKTLKELGHCTFKFNGLKEADLPGVICLENKEKPHMKIGDEIIIY